MHNERETNRREFLRQAARNVAAGGLVLGMGLLVLSERGTARADDCVRTIACGGCEAYGRCTLPRARASRGADDGR